MATVRATMPNDDELLWPGTLVNVQLTLRAEDAVVIPSAAVQVSQQGTFVFVVKDARRSSRRSRWRGRRRETVLECGLQDGDVVVTDGHFCS